MRSEGPHWRIHVGAHKTATTHVQDVLELRADALAGEGVHLVHRERARKARLASCLRPETGLIKGSWLFRRGRWSRRMAALLDGAATGTTLVSEEQLIGVSDGLLCPVFYPQAGERMGILRRLLAGAPTTLFLSIRNPATIIPSAYSQCLRAGARGIPTLDQLREQCLSRPPTWTDLVRRIRQAFPEARLVVWTFEDYIAEPAPFLGLLSGTALADWPTLEAPASTRGLSAETIGAILALDRSLSRKERVARCEELAAGDKGVRRFQPFTAGEVAALTSAYEEDLAGMERAFPGVRHRPRA